MSEKPSTDPVVDDEQQQAEPEPEQQEKEAPAPDAADDDSSDEPQVGRRPEFVEEASEQDS